MGRPKDTFWWDCVNRSQDGNDQLSCKFCNKGFKGGVSRIKLHLSGSGGNIGPCEEVPSNIRGKALKDISKKRGRYNLEVEEDNHGVNVAERGDKRYKPAMVMSSYNHVSSFSFNGGRTSTTKLGGSEGHDTDLPSRTPEEALESYPMLSFIKELPMHQRSDAVSSMVYEANARKRDPVYGCVGAILSLQQQIDTLQTQLALAQAEVVHMRMRQFTASTPPSQPLTVANSSANTLSPSSKLMASQARSLLSMDVVVDHASMGGSLWSY